MKYKTMILNDVNHERADTITVKNEIRKHGACRVYFCVEGHRNHSTMKQSIPIAACRNFDDADGDGTKEHKRFEYKKDEI